METSFLTRWLSDHEIKAICWTLIHSLWIGVITALVAGLLISFTRKASANIRYRALGSILVMFVIAVGVTYYFELKTAYAEHPVASTRNIHIKEIHIVTIKQVGTITQPGIAGQAIGFLNQNTNLIFLLWLLFFVLKSLKMTSGLLYIQRIRNYKVHPVGEEFKHKIERFSSQIGIRQNVRLMQSELVKVPVAVGWLKPVILLPMGILLQLSPEQLESILWHELAHIYRRDYVVNILQGVVETVFFFNPGLLWLSSLIRAEREACCDDIVLSRTNRKANYLEALLAFGYEDNSRAALAMSIGSGNQLRDRLKRMVTQENKRLSIAEKVVLAAGLILLSAFTTLPKADDAVHYLSHIIAKRSSVKGVSKPIDTLLIKNQSTYGYQSTDDGQVINADTPKRFTSILFKDNDIDLGNNDVRAMDRKGNQYHLIIKDGKLTSIEINDAKVTDDKVAGYQYMVDNIRQVINEKRRIRDLDIAGFKANSPQAKLKDKSIVGKDQSMRGDNPDPKFTKEENMREMAREDSIGDNADRQRANNVIAELVKAGVVPDPASIKWFGLTDTELIVNGKKQPDGLHDRLKTAYNIHKDYGLYYGPVDMVGTGVFVDVEPPVRGLMLQRHNLDQLRFKQKQLMLQDRKMMMMKQPDFKAKQLQPGSPKKEFLMQQRNMFKLDTLERRYFKTGIMLPPIIANVVTDLVDENVVKNKSALESFKLTNSVLVVNGIKQSDELHEKLKSKYLTQPKYKINSDIVRDPNFGLHYDAKQQGMGIGITIDKDSH